MINVQLEIFWQGSQAVIQVLRRSLRHSNGLDQGGFDRYGRAQKREEKVCAPGLLPLPGLVCIGVGIALSNTRAVFEAFAGVTSPFVRTPKSGDKKKSYRTKANWFPALELLMGAYCAFSFSHYLQAGKYLVGPFLLIYPLGFLMIGYCSLLEQFDFKMPRFFTREPQAVKV